MSTECSFSYEQDGNGLEIGRPRGAVRYPGAVSVTGRLFCSLSTGTSPSSKNYTQKAASNTSVGTFSVVLATSGASTAVTLRRHRVRQRPSAGVTPQRLLCQPI